MPTTCTKQGSNKTASSNKTAATRQQAETRQQQPQQQRPQEPGAQDIIGALEGGLKRQVAAERQQFLVGNDKECVHVLFQALNPES